MGLLDRFSGKGSLSETLARSPSMQLPWIGYRIFKWLLLVVAILLLLLMLYAWQSYPTAADVAATLGSEGTAESRLAATETLRTAWLVSVKDLGQMFVLTPLFPLIGAVIGYIFGVSRQESNQEAAERADATGASVVVD